MIRVFEGTIINEIKWQGRESLLTGTPHVITLNEDIKVEAHCYIDYNNANSDKLDKDTRVRIYLQEPSGKYILWQIR